MPETNFSLDSAFFDFDPEPLGSGNWSLKFSDPVYAGSVPSYGWHGRAKTYDLNDEVDVGMEWSFKTNDLNYFAAAVLRVGDLDSNFDWVMCWHDAVGHLLVDRVIDGSHTNLFTGEQQRIFPGYVHRLQFGVVDDIFEVRIHDGSQWLTEITCTDPTPEDPSHINGQGFVLGTRDVSVDSEVYIDKVSSFNMILPV